MRRFRRSKPRHENRVKRRPINVLASALTTFSLYLGLSSIFWSIQGNYENAAYLILAAMICDMLDGTVARMTKSISEFGKELDSLADLVSFGVAPAVLIYHAYWSEELMARSTEGKTGAVMAIIFVICAALRLARYNVFQSTHRESFTGLPTPAAGGAIATFVLFMNYFEFPFASAFWVLAPLVMSLAFLMVSSVRYPKDKLKRVFVLAPRNAFRLLVIAVFVIAVFHYAMTKSPAIVLFPLAMTYILFGLGNTLVWKLHQRKSAHPEAEAQRSPEASPSDPVNNADRR